MTTEKTYTQVKLLHMKIHSRTERIAWVNTEFAILDKEVMDLNGKIWIVSEVYKGTRSAEEMLSQRNLYMEYQYRKA